MFGSVHGAVLVVWFRCFSVAESRVQDGAISDLLRWPADFKPGRIQAELCIMGPIPGGKRRRKPFGPSPGNPAL
jgi:hypothetical protein